MTDLGHTIHGDGATEAIPVAPGIWHAPANANSYRISTGEESMIVDTGLVGGESKRVLNLLTQADPEPVGWLVLTHAHEDHMGGFHRWQKAFPEINIATHRECVVRWQQYDRLRVSRMNRSAILWGFTFDDMPALDPSKQPPPLEPALIVDHSHHMKLGDRDLELLHLPGAEGPDNLGVWVPDCGTLFVGDLWGPIPNAFPNLFTLRGEPLRAADAYLESLNRVIALEPEIACPGHMEPIHGAKEIATMLTRVRDATAHVFDHVVDGLNAGKGPLELMRTMELPENLQLDETYGRVDWGVRGIWEGLTGWFRYQSSTELYDVGPETAHTNLVEMAGGPDAVASRAAALLGAGDTLDALHLAEAGLHADGGHKGCLQVKLDANEALLAEHGGRNFQESGWLRHEIATTTSAIES
jgi:glyoxylase-like metal-dependent hydrolase (beta-lactamase superfamily II)